ncbi:TetR/AcrR family transcriptional regulator [Longispora sp. NPDC051575]|uniref:TetR/AcrR family transcriptional regulator n=1 Tax=Longispora sp. NPDC051575 TaxID=3154943 RepID=UPI0034307456
MVKRRLTREDWTHAAFDAMCRGGLGAVAVDPLAKVLGATRGSFYWHFTDREALLVAALELWEQLATEDMIAAMERIRDPLDRLRTLLHEALRDRRPSDVYLEPSIVAHAHDPVVGPVLRRVTERRIGYLTECYQQLGMPAEAARRQGVVAYAAYLGWVELRAAAPDIVPEVTRDRAAMDHLLGQLTPRLGNEDLT